MKAALAIHLPKRDRVEYQCANMRTIACLFFIAIGALLMVGCASGDGDASGPVSYPNPSPLDTQARIQNMHSDALRQDF